MAEPNFIFSGIINPLFTGLTIIRADILLIVRIFLGSEKYYATRKISARIIS